MNGEITGNQFVWHLNPEHPDTRIFWRKRVARIGSLIQLAFAAFWLFRGMMATGFPYRVLLAMALLMLVMVFAGWGEEKTKGLVKKNTGTGSLVLGAKINLATLIQLGASFILPEVVIFLGRPDLIVGSVSVTIGFLLLWLWMELGSPEHLLSGILLVAVPVLLCITFSGSNLTATTGIVTGMILIACAASGFRYLLKDGKTWQGELPQVAGS